MLHSAMQHDTEENGWLLQAYEALAINEFHNAPVDFLFTSPLNATVLPTLRVSGEPVQEPKCTCRPIAMAATVSHLAAAPQLGSSRRSWHCMVFCKWRFSVLHAGDGVLKEFGFSPGRFFLDACAVWLLAAAFAALTYYSLATAGLGSHSGLMLWWRQWLGEVHDDGLSGRLLTKLLQGPVREALDQDCQCCCCVCGCCHTLALQFREASHGWAS